MICPAASLLPVVFPQSLPFNVSPLDLLRPVPLPRGGCHRDSAQLRGGPRHHRIAQDPWGLLITRPKALRLRVVRTGLHLASPGKNLLVLSEYWRRSCLEALLYVLNCNFKNYLFYNNAAGDLLRLPHDKLRPNHRRRMRRRRRPLSPSPPAARLALFSL